MAILQNPLIGRAKKKIGNTVFSTVFGQNILKTKPLSIKNPKTDAQMAARKRVIKLAKLLRQVVNYINTAYAGSVQRMAAFSHVMSINLKNCFIDNTASIEPSMLVLCDNEGSFVDNVVLTSTVIDTIEATFDSRAQTADEEGDKVNAYGFHADGNKIWKFDQDATRSLGTMTLTRPT